MISLNLRSSQRCFASCLKKTASRIIFIFCCLFSFTTFAQQRLISRFIYFDNSPECSLSPRSGWDKKFVANNRAQVRYTINKNDTYQYTPQFKNLSGFADVFIYKYTCKELLDSSVKVKIFHKGVADSLIFNMTSNRDEWVKIGRYEFDGHGKEYVQIVRITPEQNNSVTPVFPIRFDLYYDMHTRLMTRKETEQTLPVGLTVKGNWKKHLSEGYRKGYSAMRSTSKGDQAIWNPAGTMEGKINIYLYRPKVNAKDDYLIVHNGKVDMLYLPNLRYSNLELCNPMRQQGWYKLGEFDFSGKGNEYISLQKHTNDTTNVECMMLEKVNLDGTLLDRTIITPISYKGNFKNDIGTFSLEQKLEVTKIVPGLTPYSNGTSIALSSKFGSTVYSRAIWSKEPMPKFTWNPCIIVPGDYDLYYRPYAISEKSGNFDIVTSNGNKTVHVAKTSFKENEDYKIGTFSFAGGNQDEYIVMKDIKRASEITLERKLAGGAILKQVVVTAHPFFREFTYDDTKDLSSRHDIGEMVRRGFVLPTGNSVFGTRNNCSVNEFITVVGRMLDTLKIAYTTLSLAEGVRLKDRNTPDISLNEAAQLMLNAMEISGRYSNVRNYFRTSPDVILSKFDKNPVNENNEAVSRMVEMGVIKIQKDQRLDFYGTLTRLQSTVMLKEFQEQVLCSGPPSRADWDISFYDEFNGNGLDWEKWIAHDAVRFKDVSAKWKENCVVADGLFKGYNYMDNHKVPYSSGSIESTFKQMYGFFEARYRYPDKAYGSHSSFWTSAKGGDFNYNEGTYPNGVSNNNYFMKKGSNFKDFSTPFNLAHDFHTFSGFLNDKDLFYGMDGQPTFEVKDYPRYYNDDPKANSYFPRTTAMPYNAMISTVVTWFDGPLDRDRIDGTFMACDWVRVYKEIQWLPVVESVYRRTGTDIGSNQEWVIKFNKPMNTNTVDKSSIIVEGLNSSIITGYSIEQINPVRYRIVFSKPIVGSAKFRVVVKNSVKDIRGQSPEKDFSLTL